MQDRKRFIVLSTGQNVANLPPLLELAEPDDHILWLETDRARNARWTDGIAHVLERRGFRHQSRWTFDELTNLQLAVAGDACSRNILIANGGTKLQLLTVWDAIQDLDAEIAYGQDRPVSLERQPEGPLGELGQASYECASITLADVLECNAYCPVKGIDLDRQRIWPNTGHNTAIQDDYGVDADTTAGIHDAHHSWGTARTGRAETEMQDISFGDILTHAPAHELQRWFNNFGNLAFRFRKHWPQWKEDHPSAQAGDWFAQLGKDEPEAFAGIYNRIRDMQFPAYTAKQNIVKPDAALGPRFESAVARRLLTWLGASDAARIVSEVYHEVKIARRDAPGKTTAEFDLLLVLRNGILLHLECKSFEADKKDLDARTTNLWLAGSRLARMAVVMPIYTGYSDRAWFAVSAKLQRVVGDNLGESYALPFTLPGQPGNWTDDSIDPPQTHTVPTFEQGLERLLAPYRAT